MNSSSLMNPKAFIEEFENSLVTLYEEKMAEQQEIDMTKKNILHIGPGHRANGAKLPKYFQNSSWKEIRLDIDPKTEPDILGDMLSMPLVEDESIDVIFSAHNVEHVHGHEVPIAFKEFLRVLKPEGYLVITCPDLQSVAQLVASDKLEDPAYESNAGPITPLDIIYGHNKAIAVGHNFMAHKTGFTLKTLTKHLHQAGFSSSIGKRRPQGFDLWITASKNQLSEPDLRHLASAIFPH